MLTIHTADLLIPGDGRSPLPGGAVLVEGQRLAAVEVYEELAAAHPTARVRRWPGVLTPGLVNPYGPELLEQAYHPDPREDLGSEPISGEALESLGMTDARWGASARRGVQRMLAHGVVAVRGELRRPAVIDAVHRSGLTIEQRLADPVGRPSLTSESFANPLLPQAEATFAIFETPELTTCVATVIKGRLLHRRR
ncbi:imidazolonepropionase-like domain-containing protein [Streptomyces canus]|uniref:imidazolonepropionase-like domain-containing protein n=1 Tax=Streptomyces canus TaxID=58343 RepID=UPI00325173FB